MVFRLKENNGWFEFHNNPVNVVKLPNRINDPFHAVNYVIKNCCPNTKETFSSIAANDSCVAVMSSHALSDGGFFMKLFPNLLNNNIKQNNTIPLPQQELFQNEIKKFNLNSYETTTDIDYLTKTKFSYPSKNIPNSTLRTSISNSINVKDLQCYDKSNNKVNGLTESLLLALTLSISATNDKNIPLRIGSKCCVDMRKYMKNVDEKVGNNFSVANVVMKKVNGSCSLREAGKILRKDLNKKIQRENIMKTIFKTFKFDKTQLLPGLSNIGQFHLVSPINDMYIQQTMFSKAFEVEIELTTFSKISNEKNTIETNLKYSPSVISYEKGMKISKSINHILTKIPLDSTIDSVLSEINKLK